MSQTATVLTKEELIQNVLVGGKYLESYLLSEAINPHSYKYPKQVLKDHGEGIADIWSAWKAIKDLAEHE